MRASILNGALFASSSFILLTVACVSYLIFYNSYIPETSLNLPVYLRHQPYAIEANVPIEQTQDNSYQLTLSLILPCNEYNQQLGNFMVSISIGDQIVTRPAIVPYQSTLVSTARTVLSLPFLLLGLTSESTEVLIPLYEGALPKSTIPLTIDKPLRVYSSALMVNAQFTGLRYFMWNYTVTSFIVFSGVFWSIEMSMMTAVFLYLLHTSEDAAESTLSSRTGSSSQLKAGRPSASANMSVEVERTRNQKSEDLSDSFRTPKEEASSSERELHTAREIKEEDTWD